MQNLFNGNCQISDVSINFVGPLLLHLFRIFQFSSNYLYVIRFLSLVQLNLYSLH